MTQVFSLSTPSGSCLSGPGVLYAGRLRHGGNRIYTSQKRSNIIMKNLMDFCHRHRRFW